MLCSEVPYFIFLDDPCFVCGTTENVEARYVRHIRKAEGLTLKGFNKIMAQWNGKQIPVCGERHLKIHRGEYMTFYS